MHAAMATAAPTDVPASPAPPAAPVLIAHGLAKRVPGNRLLFTGLELMVRPGEIIAIMGESGMGKSTLLNLLAGLDTPDAGQVEIAGQPLSGLSDEARTDMRRDHIGFVFQAFHILPHLTLAQNVALPLLLAGHPAAEALSRAEALMADVGLPGRAQDYPAAISGGELQRIAIARALVHQPALLLADEPTGNLDPETADRVLALLVAAARQQGAALILVTHSDRAAAVADRVLRLSASGLSPHALG